MSDFNVTNNPYNMWQYYGYSYPQFRGARVQPQTTTPPPPPNKPDTVSFKGNENSNNKGKNGLSTGAKWGIGLGLSALVAIGIGIATKGRVKNTKQVVQSLEFEPATTLDSAKKYAEDKLGVEYYKVDDLEAVNFVNEWLTNLRNKCKVIDKSSYPRIVANNPALGDAPMGILPEAIEVNGKNVYMMSLNMPFFKDFKASLDKFVLKDLDIGIVKDKAGKYIIKGEAYKTEFAENLIKRINEFDPTKATFKDKNRLLLDIKGLTDGKVVNGKIKEVRYSDYFLLNHELGHIRHQECVNNYNQMQKVEEFIADGLPVSKITEEFVNNKGIQETASKVSDYAKESPLEFVADTFAYLIEGKKLPDDVMALYKKYGGPAI